MSSHHGFFALVFLLIIIQATAMQSLSSSDPLNLIKSLATSGRSPVIIVIQPKQTELEPTNNLIEMLLGNDGKESESTADENRDEAKDEAKEMLYEYLRSSPNDSKLEQEKKQALREALRQRCSRITVCIEECPSRKPKCPKKCEKRYDKERLCPSNNWGSTRPPRWLL